MTEPESVEIVDGEPMLALEVPAVGLPAVLPAHLAAELAELATAADEYAAAAQAENTSRAYASDWRQFETWCDRYRLQSLPAAPAVVALYLTSLAKRGLAVATVRRRAAAIARMHRQAGHVAATSDPSVQTVLGSPGAVPRMQYLRDLWKLRRFTSTGKSVQRIVARRPNGRQGGWAGWPAVGWKDRVVRS